ncbi:MAG: metallophosphoesterase family protein [bacterium]|nr:MAG: metallophosphoesterase family protein [bacterium]
MRSRLLLLFFLISFVIVFSFSAINNVANHSTNDKTQFTARYRLVWNDDPTTTITIAWDQVQGTDPVVCYGTEDFKRKWRKYPHFQNPTRTTTGYRGMNTHFARLAGLKPDQAYYFVIKDSIGVSKRFWFRTAPDKPEPFTFIAGGDTKSTGTALQAGRLSNRMISKLRPLFVIFNGDFTSGDGTNDERWKLWLDDWATLTTTEDGRMIPIIPVHGNHEDGDKTVLNKLFDSPYQYDNEQSIYYSISFGENFFHFIALNSQIDEGGDQRSWLEKDLKTNQHFTFKIAGYHKPFRPHTSKKSENYYQYEQWAPLFHAYSLDIALLGDSHISAITYPIRPSIELDSYQGFIRDDENGTMYVGEGSWGASPRENDDDKPWTLRSGSFNQIKWFQVFPEQDNRPAHIDIRTVITATKDEEGNIISHVDNVAELSEADVFTIPENINLFSTEPYGNVITYPFKDELVTDKP